MTVLNVGVNGLLATNGHLPEFFSPLAIRDALGDAYSTAPKAAVHRCMKHTSKKVLGI
jgi:hypothetical protein